jgi:hypothetical protein
LSTNVLKYGPSLCQQQKNVIKIIRKDKLLSDAIDDFGMKPDLTPSCSGVKAFIHFILL